MNRSEALRPFRMIDTRKMTQIHIVQQQSRLRSLSLCGVVYKRQCTKQNDAEEREKKAHADKYPSRKNGGILTRIDQVLEEAILGFAA